MADEVYVSGSRLKVQWLEGSDGSKQFSGWFDSGRKEQCTFAPSVEGTIRCLPQMASISTYFSDTGCTVQLVAAPPGSGPLWNGTPGSCFQSVGPSADFYAVGDVVDPATFVGATLKTAP